MKFYIAHVSVVLRRLENVPHSSIDLRQETPAFQVWKPFHFYVVSDIPFLDPQWNTLNLLNYESPSNALMSAPFEPNSITIIKMKGTEASFSSASFHPKHSTAYRTDAPEDTPPQSHWNLKCPKANIIFYRWQSISRQAQGVYISLTSRVEVSYLSTSNSGNPAPLVFSAATLLGISRRDFEPHWYLAVTQQFMVIWNNPLEHTHASLRGSSCRSGQKRPVCRRKPVQLYKR